MIDVKGYAAHHSFTGLKPFNFERDPAGPEDVEIEILFCGVCHSDIHQARNEWANTVYPCVPGHEIVGRVRQVGANVTAHAVGDIVGVGCMVDSCRQCPSCVKGEENYCEGPNGWLATYNGPMVPAKKARTGSNMYGRDNTFGGYSDAIVVPADFVLKIPAELAPDVAAPILCAGVTTYSPLKHWGVGPGQRVGIIGFGGLGHMAAKIAKAMGAEVTVFTTHEEKKSEAQRLGLACVVEEDKDALKALEGTFDLMLSVVPEKHDINPFVLLLKRDATIVVVGQLGKLKPLNNQEVAFHRKSTAGSLIGSIAETREVLEFCAKHGIAPDIERINIQDINEAFKKVVDADVRFRYVIDMASLRTQDP